MAAKKRNPSADDEAALEPHAHATNDSPKPPKKKPKKDKNNSDQKQGHVAPDGSVKPMERKKKRKALDKERRRAAAATESEPPKPNHPASSEPAEPVVVESPGTSGSGGAATLPEFHIGVFKDLAAAEEAAREAAAKQMVRELKAVQSAYDALEEKEVGDGGFKLEAEKDDGLDDCAPSVRYAVRRLIRGVSSSRECARQGFALGLTVLVGTIRNVRVESFLKLVVDLLEVTSSMKGQEAKDCLLGRLFAYGALARSGRLTQEWSMDKNTPCIREFISAVISLANKKRYLQEPAVSIILDLLEKVCISRVRDICP